MAGNMEKVDTANFSDTIANFEKYISEFMTITQDVHRTGNTLIDNWQGQGAKAFDKDYRLTKQNLKDVLDIMYELYNVLIECHAGYLKADRELAKRMQS